MSIETIAGDLLQPMDATEVAESRERISSEMKEVVRTFRKKEAYSHKEAAKQVLNR